MLPERGVVGAVVRYVNVKVPDFQKFPIAVAASRAERNYLAKQEAKTGVKTTSTGPPSSLYAFTGHQTEEHSVRSSFSLLGHIFTLVDGRVCHRAW